MDAHGGGTGGKEVDVWSGVHLHVADVRIRLLHLLLGDLELRHPRAFAHEVDAEVELAFARSPRQHVLNRGDDVAGLEIPAAEAKAR